MAYGKKKTKKTKSKKGSKRKSTSRSSAVTVRAPRVSSVGSRMPTIFGLSKCALKFLTALADPFSHAARGACIPSFPSLASRKVTTYLTGLVHTGTNKFGCVGASPCLAQEETWRCVYASNANNDWTGPASKFWATNDAYFTAYNLNANPYVQSQLTYTGANPAVYNARVRGRIVAAALRIRFIGREDHKGGRIYGYAAPTHCQLNDQDHNFWSGKAGFVSIPASREWTTIRVMACDTTELSYQSQLNKTADADVLKILYPFSQGFHLSAVAADGSRGAIPMMFWIYSTETGASYEWEYIQHAEYIGPDTEEDQTPSYDDPMGMGIVNNAICEGNRMASSGTTAQETERLFRQGVQQAVAGE